MRAYKGFNRNEDGTLSCRDFTYELGKTYKYDGEIELCERGFHACHELHKCWLFYPNNGKNVFCEVECGGEIIESKDSDGKLVCSEITILRKVDMSGVAAFDVAWYICEGYARVCNGNKYNHISTDGKLLSDEWFDYMSRYCNGFFVVCVGPKYNYIDIDGKLLLDEWQHPVYIDKSFLVVCKDGKYNIIIKWYGHFVSDEWLDYVGEFSEETVTFRKGDTTYKVDNIGNILETTHCTYYEEENQ